MNNGVANVNDVFSRSSYLVIVWCRVSFFDFALTDNMDCRLKKYVVLFSFMHWYIKGENESKYKFIKNG